MNRRKTTEMFVAKAQRLYGRKFDYTGSRYISSTENIEVFCTKHQRHFWIIAHIHLQQGIGCEDCKSENRRTSQIKISTKIFIKRAKKTHRNKFDYSATKYITAHQKLKIICTLHDLEFWILPHNHLKSQSGGCPNCYDLLRSSCQVDPQRQNKFIAKAKSAHGDKYDYSQVVYKGAHQLIDVKCTKHQLWFQQMAENHLKGNGGCPSCRKKTYGSHLRKSEGTFLSEALAKHGNKFDYSLVQYKNHITKVIIICPIHGMFLQSPQNHLKSSSGCSICAYGQRISLPEREWLDFLGLPDDPEHRQVRVGQKYVDGFDPVSGYIYEFLGDYYHGNPSKFRARDFNKTTKKTFGKLHKEWLAKKRLFEKAGYKVISIWESEWKEMRKNANAAFSSRYAQSIRSPKRK